MFGRKIVRHIISKKSYVEKLNYQEFKELVQWDNKFGFPEFLNDLFIYLVGFNINEYLRQKNLRELEEKDQEEFKKVI
jgi:hypothetical protein